MSKEYSTILASILDANIFSEDQILTMRSEADSPFNFFCVGNGTYFYLLRNRLYLIKSTNSLIENSEASREDKMDSIEEISLERLFLIAPKSMIKKIAFHIDLFQGLLK